MPGAGGFACPRCRMAFGSGPLLRAHEERLCLGTPAAGSCRPPGGDPPPAESPQDASAGGSRHRAEPRRLLLLPALPPAVRGQRGPARARGAPLGDVLTPRERALLRAAPGSLPPAVRDPPRAAGLRPPCPSRPPGRLGEPSRRPREPLETHERHVAQIQARTRQLERQREGLCRRLAALGTGGAAPHPGREDPGMPRGHVGRLPHGGAAPRPDTLPPAAGPLAAEARALRLSYLSGGGRDPAVLAQLLQLQAEATALETRAAGSRRGRRPEPPGAGAGGLDAALLALELENRRLEDELLALKVRRERRADAGSRAAQRHAEELARLQAEVGMLRYRVEQGGSLPPAIRPPPVAPPPPAELFTEPPGPALGTGGPAAPGRPHGPPGLPLAALEDPPPAREPPAQRR